MKEIEGELRSEKDKEKVALKMSAFIGGRAQTRDPIIKSDEEFYSLQAAEQVEQAAHFFDGPCMLFIQLRHERGPHLCNSLLHKWLAGVDDLLRHTDDKPSI